MPGTPADATAPTRLSSRVGAGSGSGGSGGGGAGVPAGTPTPPVPPMAQAPAEATGPTRLSPLVGGGLGAAPPQPPMPPPPSAASAPAGGHAAAPRAAATAPARGFPWAIVVVVLALGLLTVVGGVGALIWLRGGWGKKTDQAPTQVADQTTNTVPASYPDATRPAATEPPAVPAATNPPQTSTTAQQQPAPYPPTAPSIAPGPTRAPEPAATVKPVPTRRAEPTARPTTRPSAPVPVDTPVRPAPAPSTAPAPAAPVQEPEDAAPAQPYDREMSSTLALKFKIEPGDAIITIKAEGDRRFTNIGRANDFDADKKKMPAYDLPEAGVYYVRIVAEGRQIIYKLNAQLGANPTTIAYVLIPKAGRRRN